MRREFGIGDVQIGTANAARTHAQKQLARCRTRIGAFFNAEAAGCIFGVADGGDHNT